MGSGKVRKEGRKEGELLKKRRIDDEREKRGKERKKGWTAEGRGDLKINIEIYAPCLRRKFLLLKNTKFK
jgi:hypothetical protein